MTLVSIVIAVATVLLSTVLAALSARRAAYDRVTEAVAFVSEGSVASARHEIGALMYDEFRDDFLNGRPVLQGPGDRATRSTRIDDLFSILWAATRLNAVRESLGPTWLAPGPHRLLRRSLAPWVRYWVRPDPEMAPDAVRTRVNAVAVSLGARLDEDDLVGLRELERHWSVQPA
jgi:hypothetical protein